MPSFHQFIEIETGTGITIHDITDEIRSLITKAGINSGMVAITSQHTTTAITVNENEARLLEDIKAFLLKLAPPDNKYLHNDIHLRDCDPDEPENAHSHLMAMMLGNSEVITIQDARLVLGQWQSVKLLDLDGPRTRKISVQVLG